MRSYNVQYQQSLARLPEPSPPIMHSILPPTQGASPLPTWGARACRMLAMHTSKRLPPAAASAPAAASGSHALGSASHLGPSRQFWLNSWAAICLQSPD